MTDYRHLTRRDFVRDASLGALALGMGTVRIPVAGAAAGDKSLVVLVRDAKVLDDAGKADAATLKKMLDEVIQAVTGESSAAAGWKKLFKPDDVVGLVPTKAIAPTHGELIEAVTDALKAVGIAADRIKNVQGRKDGPTECTALVSLPGLKTHSLTGIGTVLKNYVTFSGNPRNFHMDKNVALGSIWQMPAVKGKTRLILVDALTPAYDKGPQKDPKAVWRYSGLMASTDPVAAEAISLKILQAKRNAVKGEPWEISPAPLCVAAADKEYKLGTSDPANITVKVVGWEKDALV